MARVFREPTYFAGLAIRWLMRSGAGALRHVPANGRNTFAKQENA